jgi:hypothetical protein
MRRGFLRFLTVTFFLVCLVGPVSGATIDVMIVYDTTAKSWVSSQGGMSAFAADAVARMNQAVANSNVNLTFRLIHTAEVSYTYSGSFNTDLDRLQAGTGNLSIVHQWRNTYGADVVALLVDTGSAYGIVGMGYLLETYIGDPEYAFTANAIRSVDISHTLTHEVGHNLGCHHSKTQKSSPGPNSALNGYSAGWYFTGTNATPYHTIMAYGSDGYGHSYAEAPLFSTPLLTYQGTPAGNAQDGDNARNIRTTMDIVAAYRSSVVCTYTLLPEIYAFSPSSGTGSVAVTTSSSGCSWTATSNQSWISITSGSSGTGNGTVTYSVAANNGAARTGTMTIGGQTFTITQAAPLYFPHVVTSLPWQTEIAIINTSNQTVTGTLRALSNAGQLIEAKAVTLSARGRRQFIISSDFANHTDIGYITFDTDSAAVQGYSKYYIAGNYRAAIPAVKAVNTANIYIPHIASDAQWWTEVSLVNTTAAAKQLTITFNNGQTRQITLNANEHTAFMIESLFNDQPRPDIQSAVITNASGVIGLELFGNIGGGNHLDGILLTDKTASTLYYPHVASDNVWWTGIVAYNPSTMASTITITPYSEQGAALTPSTLPIAGKGKYIGVVSNLGLPAETAWFRIDATRPLSGFEVFGTHDGTQLAAYAGGGGTGAREGVFPKIEKDGGWTGIAFVNTEATAATVTLTAYYDNGTPVATQVLPVDGHAKVVNFAEAIFSPQDISGATYIAYSSDRNIVGFQLNSTSDGMMLDGLPGLAGAN